MLELLASPCSMTVLHLRGDKRGGHALLENRWPELKIGSCGILFSEQERLNVTGKTTALLWLFSRPALRESTLWQATVTPLASIIGSESFEKVAVDGKFSIIAGLLVGVMYFNGELRLEGVTSEDVVDSINFSKWLK